jgi:hypothetical protein
MTAAAGQAARRFVPAPLLSTAAGALVSSDTAASPAARSKGGGRKGPLGQACGDAIAASANGGGGSAAEEQRATRARSVAGRVSLQHAARSRGARATLATSAARAAAASCCALACLFARRRAQARGCMNIEARNGCAHARVTCRRGVHTRQRNRGESCVACQVAGVLRIIFFYMTTDLSSTALREWHARPAKERPARGRRFRASALARPARRRAQGGGADGARSSRLPTIH